MKKNLKEKKQEAQLEKQKKARDLLYQKIDEDNITLIEAVKLIRKIFNLSQVEFALKVGLGKMTVTDFESGKGNPSLNNINKMLSPMKLEIKVGRKKV